VRKEYSPVGLTDNLLNRILDTEASLQYAGSSDFIDSIVPEFTTKKILEIRVRQAFVFDTVYFLAASEKRTMRILAIGAYADAAALALKKLGFLIDFVDPVINYDISTFITKPSVSGQMYDIIASTSGIDRASHDQKFMKDIEYLLKPGGWGILTCILRDDREGGDDGTGLESRFFSKSDLTDRLLAAVPGCTVVGDPDWRVGDYEFTNRDKYRYTLASLVFKKSLR
jgi:hypothetical protein